jgi:uncharacterized membrane protein YuzA (DUF378 family)
MAITRNDYATADRAGADTSAPVRHSSTKAIDIVALVLMIVGGLNWGLVGLFNTDLVATLFGANTMPSRAVYVLVGLAALWGIVTTIRLASRDR